MMMPIPIVETRSVVGHWTVAPGFGGFTCRNAGRATATPRKLRRLDRFVAGEG